MKNSQAIINIDPKTDTEIATHVFETLQREIELQFESMNEHEPTNKHVEKTQADRGIAFSEALRVKDEAIQRHKINSRSREPLSLLLWATGELKKLDNRPADKIQQTVNTAFSRAIADKLTELKGRARLSRWEDKLWHHNISNGKSLSSLSSLLSDAGGCGPVKVEWQWPEDMDLLWLDRSWLTTSGSEALSIWSLRPLKTCVQEGRGSGAQNIDLYRLQEELVERGLYAKYSHSLSKVPSRKRALDEFAGELRCIWWLHSDYVKIVQDIFTEVGESFDVLWNVVRKRLVEWSNRKLSQNSEELWYDYHHNLLADKASASNENICQSLKDLFRTAIVECREMTASKITSQASYISQVTQEVSSEKIANAETLRKKPVDVAGSKSVSDPKSYHDISESSSGTAVDLFIGGVDANDIRQGATLQDCWLLSALSILAGESGDDNTFIENLFVRQSINGELYTNVHDPHRKSPPRSDYHIVQFYRADKDEWEHVVIDEMIPAARPLGGKSRGDGAVNVASKSGKSVYGHSREPETWVMQIEKAYAKWLRSDAGYNGLNLGLVTEALVALTGGASQELNLRSSEIQAEAKSGKLWGHLKQLQRQGAMLGAGSPAGEDSFWDSSGIVQGHAYAILDLRMVQMDDGDTGMLLLRNPWGRNPWDMDPPMW